MLRLRGIDFGPILNASGAQGFFGEGYPYHKLLRPLGLTYEGVTFVAKTTTFYPRLGNMPMREDGITPREFKPKCIIVKPLQGVALNAVGLSGPGALALLETKRWQQRTDPFFISFMGVGNPASHAKQVRDFVDLLIERFWVLGRSANMGLQINMSCPNVGLKPDELISEVGAALDAAAVLGIPLVPKFNALLPPEVAVKLAEHPECDALCISNTIPWGEQVEWSTSPELTIDWRGLFGAETSPLAHIEEKGGGLSGKPLLPIVEEWVKQARAAGLKKPIDAGGGILHPDDVGRLFKAGANAVSIGAISMLRPWRMREVIGKAHEWGRPGDVHTLIQGVA